METWWLKAAWIDYLTVLKDWSPTSFSQVSAFFSGGFREESVSLAFPPLEAIHIPWLVVLSSLFQTFPKPAVFHLSTDSSIVPLFGAIISTEKGSLILSTLVLRLDPQDNLSHCPISKILILIVSVRSLLWRVETCSRIPGIRTWTSLRAVIPPIMPSFHEQFYLKAIYSESGRYQHAGRCGGPEGVSESVCGVEGVCHKG